jgi:hypothetical protein
VALQSSSGFYSDRIDTVPYILHTFDRVLRTVLGCSTAGWNIRWKTPHSDRGASSYLLTAFLEGFPKDASLFRYSANDSRYSSSEPPSPGVSVQTHQSTVSKISTKDLFHSQELPIIITTQRNDPGGGASVASKRTQFCKWSPITSKLAPEPSPDKRTVIGG